MTHERIKAEAEAKYPGRSTYMLANRNGYIAGATAEHSRAQVLADALEWIKTYGPAPGLTVEFIDKTLREWKGEKEPPLCCANEIRIN